MSWLDPVRRALDDAPATVSWFFRDDDAGWDNDALASLLDVFATANTPIDVAAIPAELTADLARALTRRMALQPLAVHQHGWTHTNHEPDGERKCEFGPSRSRVQQREDLAAGKQRIEEAFGDAGVFVPPWNRLTDDTLACLHELGYSLASRDRTAKPANTLIPETSVTVDWTKNPADVDDAIVASIVRDPFVGVMLHHAVMRDELMRVAELLAVVAQHPNALCVLLTDVA